jgi:hypothetical protein
MLAEIHFLRLENALRVHQSDGRTTTTSDPRFVPIVLTAAPSKPSHAG